MWELVVCMSMTWGLCDHTAIKHLVENEDQCMAIREQYMESVKPEENGYAVCAPARSD